jgi:hypothetical protein
MKIGKVADLFGVTTETIRNWVKNPELREFFSVTAKGEGGSKFSDFSEDDVIVLTSIYTMTKGGNYDWRSIAENLRSGWRESRLPERAAAVAVENNAAMQLASRALVAESRLKEALSKIDIDSALIIKLNDRIMALEQEKSITVEKFMREKETLLREKAEIERELAVKIAELKTELRFIRERESDDGR